MNQVEIESRMEYEAKLAVLLAPDAQFVQVGVEPKKYGLLRVLIDFGMGLIGSYTVDENGEQTDNP